MAWLGAQQGNHAMDWRMLAEATISSWYLDHLYDFLFLFEFSTWQGSSTKARAIGPGGIVLSGSAIKQDV